jgi:chromosome segregation ATPase
MISTLLRRKQNNLVEQKLSLFSEQLGRAFAQVKSDMSEIREQSLSNQQAIHNISQWIAYLHRSHSDLLERNSKILQKHTKIEENHEQLHTSQTNLKNQHDDLKYRHSQLTKTLENLENSHQKLSSVVFEHKNDLKSEFRQDLEHHKDRTGVELKNLKTYLELLSNHLNQQKGNETDVKHNLNRLESNWQKSYYELRELLDGIKRENTELKTNLSHVKQDINSTKEAVKNTLDELEKSKISEKFSKSEAQPDAQAQSAPPASLFVPAQTPSSFQKHIMSRVLPNRKGYVLKFILDLISENKYSTKELEEIVVNEKQVCGRTSFYAYLKELKLKGRINYADIDERSILINTDTQQRLQ